jgi:deoxyxylulose-5-phosphate synthase
VLLLLDITTLYPNLCTLQVRPMVLPDHFIETGTQTEQYDEAGLSANHIEATVLRLVERSPVKQLAKL